MNERLLEKLEQAPFVYQYTSIEALFAILEGYRKKREQGCLPIKASCIYNVNDPREMKHGYDAVKMFLPQYEAKLQNSMNLSEVFEDKKYEEQCIECLDKKPKDDMIQYGIVPYTISFSGNRDFLPMWSMYARNCKGVCMKFESSELINSIGDSTQVDFVSYAGDNVDYIMEEHFSMLYEWDASNCTNPMTIDEKINELSILCNCISPFIKSQEWSYENEFRIVCYHHFGPNLFELDHNSIRHFLIHGIEKTKIAKFVYYPIKVNALKEIIVGTLANYDVVEHILRKELEECLLNDVEITPSSIAISK